MTNYKPIDCSLHDRLESVATLRQTVQLVYESPRGTTTLEDRIVDVFSKNDEEFIRLASGQTIRLDHILRLDDIDFR